jgi:hypothetical protein
MQPFNQRLPQQEMSPFDAFAQKQPQQQPQFMGRTANGGISMMDLPKGPGGIFGRRQQMLQDMQQPQYGGMGPPGGVSPMPGSNMPQFPQFPPYPMPGMGMQPPQQKKFFGHTGGTKIGLRPGSSSIPTQFRQQQGPFPNMPGGQMPWWYRPTQQQPGHFGDMQPYGAAAQPGGGQYPGQQNYNRNPFLPQAAGY